MAIECCCLLVDSPLEMAYREGKVGTLQTWASDKEDIHQEGDFLILLLNQAKASFQMEINSYFGGTSSNNSAVAAKSKSKPSIAQNEVALIRQATICTTFKHLRSQY